MARSNRFSRYRQRARVIIQRVRSRRPRPTSFLKKNKTLLIVLGLGACGYFFKDKIQSFLAKK